MERKPCDFIIENLLRGEQTTSIVLDDADSTMMECQNSMEEEDHQDGIFTFFWSHVSCHTCV